jgi:hypothetical protein
MERFRQQSLGRYLVPGISSLTFRLRLGGPEQAPLCSYDIESVDAVLAGTAHSERFLTQSLEPLGQPFSERLGEMPRDDQEGSADMATS